MDKNKQLEKAEKVTKALDEGIKKADEKLSEVPSMLGEHRSKVIVGLTLLTLIALVRDQSLLVIGLFLFVVLYSSKIVEQLKKRVDSAKKEEKVEKETVVTIVEEKKE